MTGVVLICGEVFDGVSDALTGPAEILIEDNRISRIDRSVGRPPGARVVDLSDRTVSPGFIDTHVHLTMDAANLAAQTLESSTAKAQLLCADRLSCSICGRSCAAHPQPGEVYDGSARGLQR